MSSTLWQVGLALAGLVGIFGACSEQAPARNDTGIGDELDVGVILLIDLPAQTEHDAMPDHPLPSPDGSGSPPDMARDSDSADMARDSSSRDSTVDLPSPDSTVDLPPPDTVPDSIVLHGVTIVGGRVKVEYSKNFATCANLLDAQHTVLHNGNEFCAAGDNQQVTVEMGSFTRALATGDEVYLCHRNRCALVNSALVVVTRVHLAFTSSQTYQGNFGSLAAADAICQANAAAAGLAGSYKAILSDRITSARDRLSFDGAIANTSESEIARDAADLWDGAIARRLNTTASGSASPYHLVWTCTRSDGSVDQRSGTCCSNWTSVSGGVETGSTSRSDYGWIAIYDQSSSAVNACSNQGLLYCVEQ